MGALFFGLRAGSDSPAGMPSRSNCGLEPANLRGNRGVSHTIPHAEKAIRFSSLMVHVEVGDERGYRVRE